MSEMRYRKYENEGFQTPTGKFELYSSIMEQAGVSPLPLYREPPLSPISTPELAKTFPLILASIEKVGIECHECHISNMAKVQQKYHWGNFEEIKLKDPPTNEEVNFAQFKQRLNVNFVGIGLDVEQGQRDNAKTQLQAFRARIQAFQTTCQACHEKEETKYHVDQSAFSLLKDMELELSRSDNDPKGIASLTQKVGMESCFKCHLVHIPSAYAKLHWKR